MLWKVLTNRQVFTWYLALSEVALKQNQYCSHSHKDWRAGFIFNSLELPGQCFEATNLKVITDSCTGRHLWNLLEIALFWSRTGCYNHLVLLKFFVSFNLYQQAAAKHPFQYLTLRFVKTGQNCVLFFSVKHMKRTVHVTKAITELLFWVQEALFLCRCLHEGKLQG